jgi:hypothetical protein
MNDGFVSVHKYCINEGFVLVQNLKIPNTTNMLVDEFYSCMAYTNTNISGAGRYKFKWFF